MTTQGMMMFSFVRLLNPDAAAAVDEEAAADVEVGVEEVNEPVSFALAELMADAAEPAAPINALRGLTVLLAAWPNTPEARERARTTARRDWRCMLRSQRALTMSLHQVQWSQRGELYVKEDRVLMNEQIGFDRKTGDGFNVKVNVEMGGSLWKKMLRAASHTVMPSSVSARLHHR